MSRLPAIFARATLASVGSPLAVVVCLCVSVCLSHAVIVSKRLNVTSRKQCHPKAQGHSFLTPTVVGGRRPIPPKICAQSDPLQSFSNTIILIYIYQVTNDKRKCYGLERQLH